MDANFSHQVYTYMPEQGQGTNHGYPSAPVPSYEYSQTHWPMYYTYTEPEYAPFQDVPVPYQQPPCPDLPLHAPVPMSSFTTLLSHAGDGASQASPVMPYVPSLQVDTSAEEQKPLVADRENPLDVYLGASPVLFPTPSELLADMNTHESGTVSSDTESAEKGSPKYATASSSLGKRKRDTREKPENLNQRKAYFRSVSDNVGFTITDPDTITSHDKKRSYLECLEEYIPWLYKQLQFQNLEPVPLERITSYRGLRNNSLRTILVHKQNLLQKLNVQKMEAEEKFMELHRAILMRQAAEESLQFRRHSIAMGAIPQGVVPNFASH